MRWQVALCYAAAIRRYSHPLHVFLSCWSVTFIQSPLWLHRSISADIQLAFHRSVSAGMNISADIELPSVKIALGINFSNSGSSSSAGPGHFHAASFAEILRKIAQFPN